MREVGGSASTQSWVFGEGWKDGVFAPVGALLALTVMGEVVSVGRLELGMSMALQVRRRAAFPRNKTDFFLDADHHPSRHPPPLISRRTADTLAFLRTRTFHPRLPTPRRRRVQFYRTCFVTRALLWLDCRWSEGRSIVHAQEGLGGERWRRRRDVHSALAHSSRSFSFLLVSFLSTRHVLNTRAPTDRHRSHRQRRPLQPSLQPPPLNTPLPSALFPLLHNRLLRPPLRLDRLRPRRSPRMRRGPPLHRRRRRPSRTRCSRCGVFCRRRDREQGSLPNGVRNRDGAPRLGAAYA